MMRCCTVCFLLLTATAVNAVDFIHVNTTSATTGVLDVTKLIEKLKTSPASLDLQLFADDADDDPLTYQATITNTTSSKVVWHGEQQLDGKFGSANLYVMDGRLTGSITFDNQVCSLATYPDGQLQVHYECININDFEPGLEPATVAEAEVEPTTGTLQGEELQYIDVMVIYTHRAMCGEAALPYPCEITEANKKPIEDRAALGVEETNAAYERSGMTKGKMRLAHVYLDEQYDDSPAPYDAGLALDHLSNPIDGQLDDLFEKRKKYGADLVTLWVEDLNGCGLAYTFYNDPKLAVSVMQRDCTTGYYTFGHELGHNQGCKHDRWQYVEDGDPEKLTEFAHAYRDVENEFRTIVGYACYAPDDIEFETDLCPKVQRFSNIRTMVQGLPLGNAENDNIRQIEATWDAVASYMPMAKAAEAEAEVKEVRLCNLISERECFRACKKKVSKCNKMCKKVCRKKCCGWKV